MNVLDNAAFRECTSCQLCAAVCPKEAIKIELNKDGYYRPVIDDALCIDCGICTKVCYKFDEHLSMSQDADMAKYTLYAAWSKDDALVKQTTSGGIGDLLARELIAEGYKVVGVVYNDSKIRAEHAIATTEEETVPFRGSKYIQSYTLDAMREVVKNCRNEKYAVFGTPCQIYALCRLASMKKVRDNFVFVDLYCHGCPSLHVWKKYQNYIKQKLNISKFDKVEFRSKVKGWGSFYVVVVVVDGQPIFISNPKEDGFYELFFCNQVLNDGCRDCLLRGTLEYTDIRLGDFWGKKFLDNHRGVSGVSLASDRGKEVFEKITRKLYIQKCEYTEFLPYQSWGREYHTNMEVRMAILESLQNESQSINDAVAVFRRHQSMAGKIKRHIKSVLYYLPIGFTTFLKKII
ncbi:MAG: Coenzyme F420 hydrogenase/dehydrogenase, beta subunit C-terminal domain [Bacteroidales bacterium]|nr:Coenzyme F420 hydrogenase/dehydrogenase, beta subunit C-terminal domain [Bacteroidales bacterium]